ncbi:hypothetical protein, partial [Photobacterium sp. OFAV2-7]|uniref:hypothetical protein n=1 Tax=Photobacterium sp. OFAV2-7 TaxID=2917748 RepID=UPI001EF475A5
HALVRDISYDSIHWQTRQELHELIAETMIATSDKPDRYTGHQIAQHYQQAKQAFSASWWYEYAATKAASIYAVAEAIQLYQRAFELCVTCAGESGQPDLYQRILDGYSSSLSRDGQHQKARTLLTELIDILQQKRELQVLATAQLSLGKAFEVVHQHEQALAHYQAALESLSQCEHSHLPTESSWWQIWLEIKRAVLNVYYWLGNIGAMKSILVEAEPVALAIGDNKQLAKYYDDVLHLCLRDKRYVCGEYELATASKALKAARLSGDPTILANAFFSIGFCYCHTQESAEAQQYLAEALALAEKNQDRVLQTRCCTYLTVACRLMGEVQQARRFALCSLKLAEDTAMDDYIAAALANLSWTYFAENNTCQSIDYLEQSLEKWNRLAGRYPFPFLWLSHLHAVALCGIEKDFATKQNHQISMIVQCLLDKHQAKLPLEIEDCLMKLSISNKDNRHIYIADFIQVAHDKRFI